MKNILVLGGTGFVGRALCERLVQRNGGSGGRILVPTRRQAHGQRLQSLPTLEVLQADVHDPATLARLLAQADAVVNLVAILHGSAAQFEAVHVELPRRLLQACLSAAERRAPMRLLQVSALGVGADAPSHYLRSKTAGEALVKAAAGVASTVFRPSVIFGAEDQFLNLFATLQRLAPLLPLAGSSARFQPVWVEDVASAIVAALDRPDSIGKTYELTGPQVYALSDLVRLAGRWSGHERAQIALPEALGRLQALAMEWLPGTPLMSRDNIDSMKTPNVASGQWPGLKDLGVQASALEAVAPQYLGPHFARARLDGWRRQAGRH